MPRFKQTNYNQINMVPVGFKSQLTPGASEYTLDYLIDELLDLSIFDHRNNMDKIQRYGMA